MNTIGWAVKQLQDGARVRRSGWNGKGMCLYYFDPVKNPLANFQPFVVMVTVQGTHVPWLCSQTDLLSTDWELAE